MKFFFKNVYLFPRPSSGFIDLETTFEEFFALLGDLDLTGELNSSTL